MSTLTQRFRGARLGAAGAIAGVIAAGALATPAMAASDTGSVASARKAGGDQHDLVTMRKAGGDKSRRT